MTGRNETDDDGGDSRGSVFWRIPNVDPDKGDREAESQIEITAEGYVPREVLLGDDGTPLDITRPGEYGIWNDSPIPLSPPGTPQFAETWGAWGTEISQEEFEETYARADTALPQKHPAGWLACLLGCLGVIALLSGAIWAARGAVSGFLRSVLG